MAANALRQNNEEESSKAKSFEKDTLKLVKGLNTPELVIALCGPIGTPLNEVSKACAAILEAPRLGYVVKELKMSQYIKDHFKDLIRDPKYSHYASDYLENFPSKFELKKRLIEIGDCLREKYKSTFLAECAIKQRALARHKKEKNEEKNEQDDSVSSSDKLMSSEDTIKEITKGKRVAFIINSIKNQAEYELLKHVYRDLFYMIGVTSSLDNRIDYLQEENGMSKGEIWDLIDKETGEEIENGQTVKDTFPQADYFINVSIQNSDELQAKTFRFFELVFSSDVSISTPTIEETAMYVAASASWNSACLSRQVGAALTDINGEILSVGWNDVPIYGGGLYQQNKRRNNKKNDGLFYNTKFKDERCFKNGFCSNDEEKTTMSKKIVETLDKGGLLNKTDGYIKKAEESIRKSKINSLVEFSRAIHAEMHAIMAACVTSGERVKSGKLFITTYPCHICARHIILAGIKEVYYIEPYKKSLTTVLHGDSITDDEDLKIRDKHKVLIRQFEGVGPSRYMQLFKMLPNTRKEKSTGKMLVSKEKDEKLNPKYSISLTALPMIETAITDTLAKKLTS